MATMLLTGVGRGLGRATAERLTRLGHTVIGTTRAELDLASLASVRAYARAAHGQKFDVIFNIAGVMQQSPTRRLTSDGFEETLGVNVLAPFLLTRLLLPHLSSTGRVVNVSSRMHLPGSRGVEVRFDFDDPQLERDYHPDRAYKNSKLAMLWFTYELARRGVNANAVCPGFVPATALESSRKPFERFLMKHVLTHMPFARSVDEAVDAFVFMATHGGVGAKGGRFFGEKHELESSPESRDEGKAKRFWELASRLTGLEP